MDFYSFGYILTLFICAVDASSYGRHRPFECYQEGELFEYSGNRCMYLECVHNQKVPRSCPPGLGFDSSRARPRSECMIWLEADKCRVSKTKSSPKPASKSSDSIVLYYPQPNRPQPMPSPTPKKSGQGNLVEELIRIGCFHIVQLAVRAGLGDALATGGPFTVFGPGNDAFENLPQSTRLTLLNNKTALAAILSYHVSTTVLRQADFKNDQLIPSLVSGQQIRINTGTVRGETVNLASSARVKREIVASNGVIHVMDEIMFPPTGDLVDFLKGSPAFNPNPFSLLLRAVQAAGMDSPDMLGGAGPFTILAPSDEAFADIENADSIFSDNKKLFALLANHIIPGSAVFLNQLGDPVTVQTIQGRVQITNDDGSKQTLDVMGEPLEVSRNVTTGIASFKQPSGDVSINLLADFLVTNGVVHVIDRVLVPSNW